MSKEKLATPNDYKLDDMYIKCKALADKLNSKFNLNIEVRKREENSNKQWKR